MFGGQNVGYITDGGKVLYTDWGQLSIELALGIRGDKGQKIDLCVRDCLGQLHKAINNDVKGRISIQEFWELPSDGNWLIIVNHLYGGRHGDWLRH